MLLKTVRFSLTVFFFGAPLVVLANTSGDGLSAIASLRHCG